MPSSWPGGFIDPGMAMYNFLRGIPVPVTTYNYGNVDSVATVVYCAGRRRLATPQCRFLIHGVTWTFSQPATLTEQQLREMRRSSRASRRCGGSRRRWPRRPDPLTPSGRAATLGEGAGCNPLSTA